MSKSTPLLAHRIVTDVWSGNPVDDLTWQEHQACTHINPEVFFTGRTDEIAPHCIPCPVREACQEYGVVMDEKFGVWGGLGRSAIVQIRKHRRQLEQMGESA